MGSYTRTRRRSRSVILLLCDSLLTILLVNTRKHWKRALGAVSTRMEVAEAAGPAARVSRTARSSQGTIGGVDDAQTFKSTFGDTLALQASTVMPGPQVGGLTGKPNHCRKSVGATGVGFLESSGAEGQHQASSINGAKNDPSWGPGRTRTRGRSITGPGRARAVSSRRSQRERNRC